MEISVWEQGLSLEGLHPSSVFLITVAISVIVATGIKLFYHRLYKVSWSEAVIAALVASLAGLTVSSFEPVPYLPSILVVFPLTVVGTLTGTMLLSKIKRQHHHVETLRDIDISRGENENVEFKSYSRYNPRSKTKDTDVEFTIVKTIAGFLNSNGGVLLIGVRDDGVAIGFAEDVELCRNGTLDGYELWFRDLLNKNFPLPLIKTHVQLSFVIDTPTKKTLALVSVLPTREAVFVSHKNVERFYVRTGNETRSLSISETLTYLKTR